MSKFQGVVSTHFPAKPSGPRGSRFIWSGGERNLKSAENLVRFGERKAFTSSPRGKVGETNKEDDSMEQRPKLKLVGEDGNAFAILGRAHRAARKAGMAEEQWKQILAEATSGDYDHLLQTMLKYFAVDGEDDE